MLKDKNVNWKKPHIPKITKFLDGENNEVAKTLSGKCSELAIAN